MKRHSLIFRISIIITANLILLLGLAVTNPAFATGTSNPTRHLSTFNVSPSQVFIVTVNFTSPEDQFNSISLTEFAPEGWSITADKSSCTPVANTAKCTANKAEFAWYGPFDSGIAFTVNYQVTVPGGAPPGVFSFNNGVLNYFIGGSGSQTIIENISGDAAVNIRPAVPQTTTTGGSSAPVISTPVPLATVNSGNSAPVVFTPIPPKPNTTPERPASQAIKETIASLAEATPPIIQQVEPIPAAANSVVSDISTPTAAPVTANTSDTEQLASLPGNSFNWVIVYVILGAAVIAGLASWQLFRRYKA
jgi:hypothetical protein